MSITTRTGWPGGAQATYDPSDRLYQITQGAAVTRFLYDGTRLVGEYNGSSVLQNRYLHGAGVDEPLVWYDGTTLADKRWLHRDERGSVIAVESGAGVTKNTYDEFGLPSTGNPGR